MLLHFCPQCGSKLQPGFRFCPSCGEKLPALVDPPVEAATSGVSQITVSGFTATASINPPATSEQYCTFGEGLVYSAPSPVSTRQALRRTRKSTPPGQVEDAASVVDTPPRIASPRQTDQSPKPVLTLRKRRAVTPPLNPTREDPPTVSSPTLRSPAAVKGKTKKAKRTCVVEPLQEGEELSDTTGRKWRLAKLLGQNEPELIYAVQQTGPGINRGDCRHVLKLGPKDGRIFNEQNFLQRAAKPTSVDKWMKRTKMDFLGIPSCVGFGLHAEIYRFLIVPSMGQTLQVVLKEQGGLLSETAVLQLASRILDVLEFIHENEYVHGDVQAENIFIQPGGHTQVYLAGYGHAFRYCPGGRHVEYREGSRTPHEGALEFISLDSHKGAGPSRRSDLQGLGYCMLHWLTGALPWSSLLNTPSRVATEKQRWTEDIPGLIRHCYGKKTASRSVEAYLSEVMGLQYVAQPDYQALKGGLTAALQLHGGGMQQPLHLQVRTKHWITNLILLKKTHYGFFSICF
ncbi:inactive serine/threonine-protein kinase VRK3 isoform X3 [Osmerus eperlanus]